MGLEFRNYQRGEEQLALEWLHQQLTDQYGQGAEEIGHGLSARRITSLRVNTLKTSTADITRQLAETGLSAEQALFYPDALKLPPDSEPALKKLTMFSDGEIYLQSLSSMIPPLLLDANPGDEVLDMCAAPGGKTSEIVQLSKGQCMVTACEPDHIRCERLRSNLRRLGCERVNVLNTDARKLDDFLRFDRILLDAPCSGSGTLQLNRMEEKQAFSQKLVANSVRLQKELLIKACKLLKRGGKLVYSTCSLLQQENEGHFAAKIPGFEKMRLAGIQAELFSDVPLINNAMPGTMTVMPGSNFEGFFVAVFEKVG